MLRLFITKHTTATTVTPQKKLLFKTRTTTTRTTRTLPPILPLFLNYFSSSSSYMFQQQQQPSPQFFFSSYPKRIEHKTVIHGQERVDHYSWIRNKDTDEDVLKYIHQENEHTETRLLTPTVSLQQDLYKEFLTRVKETDESVPFKSGDYMYYHRTVKGLEYAINCRKPILSKNDKSEPVLLGEEQVLLDLNQLAKKEKLDFVSLGAFDVSPDHSILAYSLDTEGDETYTMFFKDLKTGKLLDDVIEEVTDDIEWAADGKTIFYCTMDDALRPYKIYRHSVRFEQREVEDGEEEEEEDEDGDDEENTTESKTGHGEEEEEEGDAEEEVDRGDDECIYTETDERFVVNLSRTSNDKYLLFTSGSHTTTEIRYLEANDPHGELKILIPRQQGLEYDVDQHDKYFYILDNSNGRKNFRLVRTLTDDPSLENSEEILPHEENRILEGVLCFKSFIALQVRDCGLPKLLILNPETFESKYIAFPDASYSLGDGDNYEFDSPFIRLYYSSFVTPPTVFDYHVETAELRKVRQFDVYNYNPELYSTELQHAKSSVDGTLIPISIVYKSQGDNVLVKDGSAPCLFYGYGSYSSSYDPDFDSTVISLLDRGFVVAIAHIRGGGEYGKKWHEQGRLLSKKNTFSDFIDCAEYLIQNKYTSSDRLAIRGASAGGLLVGNVVNARPDLFAAAINEVGFVDVTNSMLDTSLPLTTGEFEEFGNPAETKEMFEYMQSYSPYDNVLSEKNISSKYPAMYITTALNDPRVGFFESVKYVAKMRWYFANMHQHGPPGHTLYLRTNLGEGHSGKSGRYESLKDEAIVFAFLLTHLPVPGFTANNNNN